jgi:hypothetical protein
MKYEDLVFEPHGILSDTWCARHKFPNGDEISIIKGQFINRIEVWDFKNDPVSGLDPGDVDEILADPTKLDK